MNLLLPAVVSGIAVGMLYGLLAFATVVLFKATGTVNFAQGSMGALSAFVTWRLLTNHGANTALAVVTGLAFSILLGVVTYQVSIRFRDRGDATNTIVRTLALSLLFTALIDRLWGAGQPFQFPQLLTSGGMSVAGVQVSYAALETLGIAAVLLAGFGLLFRFTDFGLLTRAMADSREVTRLLGVPNRRLATVIWGITAALGTVVALLSAHTLFLSTSMMDSYLLYGFTAAIAFGLNSLTGAIIGGLVVGLISNVVSTYQGSDWANILMFAVLVAILIIRPQGLLGRAEVRRV
ncbi:branched-chain amino acid ABC transporter permease [Streptomyces sp. NBC_00841]|uniref:branched-chain amino acid ABC transporter permease n=1 Tax=Streptomyces sp. NBC_00841 TaxID=2975847 RepID=UPI002DD85589|nr:branched-chain amino acid ABC transporter permease [Streptomyces sp. NBC_00841]WRZ96779.1 branched-chain amino acid ABC transporter permease [Streptomyces sp. NBC_00841]